jgi:rare lipoprotein A
MNKLILAVSFVAICSHVASAEASKTRTLPSAHKHAPTTQKTKHSHVTARSHHAHSGNGQTIASWYGNKFHGRPTSSGELYDMYKLTAAHRTLPLHSYARVTNLKNHRSVVVRINDRGGFHGKRAMDLSYAAAKEIGIDGIAAVEITPLGFD